MSLKQNLIVTIAVLALSPVAIAIGWYLGTRTAWVVLTVIGNWMAVS